MAETLCRVSLSLNELKAIHKNKVVVTRPGSLASGGDKDLLGTGLLKWKQDKQV